MKNPLNQKCYVNFTAWNHYTANNKPGRKYFDSLPEDTYFCMGNVGNLPQSPAGKAMLYCWNNGTSLIPIFDMKGNEIILPEYAGKTIKGSQLQNA